MNSRCTADMSCWDQQFECDFCGGTVCEEHEAPAEINRCEGNFVFYCDDCRARHGIECKAC